MKALLILVGGRPITNIMSALHLRPDIIFPIASKEAMRKSEEWDQSKNELERICPDGVQEPVVVDAFDFYENLTACKKAIDNFPDAEWYLNLTCGTKIMGFAAYEIAKKSEVTAFYLDTFGNRNIIISGKDPKIDFYKINVEDYFSGYGFSCKSNKKPVDDLIQFSKQLAKKPIDAMKFRKALRNSFHSIKKDKTFTAKLSSRAKYIEQMCVHSKRFGLVQSFRKVGNDFELTVEGNSLWKFFDGDWLEIFTYQSAIESKCFDYLDYGIEFYGYGMSNELDLVATSKASLWIAECKTEEDFKVENLEKLSSIASTLGGNYVGRFLILSNSPNPYDESEKKSFESYWQKARTRDVVIITGDKLKNLPQIFQNEINNPTYPRG